MFILIKMPVKNKKIIVTIKTNYRNKIIYFKILYDYNRFK